MKTVLLPKERGLLFRGSFLTDLYSSKAHESERVRARNLTLSLFRLRYFIVADSVAALQQGLAAPADPRLQHYLKCSK